VLLDPDDPDRPHLCDDVVEDDALLAEAIDDLLAQDPLAQERLGEIAMHHAWLAACVDPGAWQLFVRIEEMTTARDDFVTVARWAYRQGQASRGTPA
jgi:hypothetical protein